MITTRVFVDTSVWIDYFRGIEGQAQKLRLLLDEDRVALPVAVRVEILSGVSTQTATRLKRLLGAVPTYQGTNGIWDRIENWALFGARRGQRFGVADLFIAAIAVDHGGSLWSLDKDFHRMAKLGFVELFDPQKI